MSSIKHKIIKYKIVLTGKDIIDVTILHIKKDFIGFVLNYRAKIKDKWHQIYRVDTCHGYLHEQRFWISDKPLEIKGYENSELSVVFILFRDEIKNNYQRYGIYYENGIQS